MTTSGLKKTSGREPDWGRFGLSDETRPLNPSSTRGESNNSTGGGGLTSTVDTKNGRGQREPYGGHAQDDNELFAQDQNAAAPPWYLYHFFLSERVLFGTWDGVFTSCLINIFGVIVFLRSGWVVAEAGIGLASLIVLSAVSLILISVVSAIGICERCHVQSGGVYFLISHVLGSRRGAAVGIIYILGQAVGNALCATGFGESTSGLITQEPSPLIERLIAAAVILVLTLINLAGVKWVVRLQFFLLVVLFLGAADFGVGSFTHRDPENGFHGWNMTIWKNNTMPQYTEHQDWFSVFGVFFPAVTGVMAGINMSGDLRNPSRDISVGTLTAILVASFMYMFFMVVLAGTCDRAALLDNYMITEKVSGLGILLLFALYTSSVSSCLATLYGIPRVLQSIAAENIIPVMARLSEGKGPNKVPVNALLLISGLTLVFIAIGEMNRLATLATMPFLITYAAIEYAYFVLSMQFDMNQKLLQDYRTHGLPSPTFDGTASGTAESRRPDKGGRKGSGMSSEGATTPSSVDSKGEVMLERKSRDEEFEQLLEKHNVDEIEKKPRTFYSRFFNRWISLAGVVIKLALMFLIHWGYSALCIGICVAIWWYVGMTAPGCNQGIASDFSLFNYIRNLVTKTPNRQDPPNPASIEVVTLAHPGVMTKSSQLNETNSDYASRSSFHQTHTMKDSAAGTARRNGSQN